MTQRRVFGLLACLVIYRPVGYCADGVTLKDTVALNTAAARHYALASYGHAERLWLRALDTSEAMEQAVIASNLAGLYRKTGRLTEAERYFQLCYQLRLKLLGSDHTDTAIALNNLATLKITRADFDQAEQHLRQALRASGLTDVDRSSLESNLGNLLRITGRVAEARTHLLSSLRISSNKAPIYLNLGRLAEDLLDFDQADQHYQTALLFGVTATIEAHLGHLRLKMGDLVSARRLLESALRGAPLAEEATWILRSLAEVEMKEGRVRQAASVYGRAVELQQRMLGRNHPSVVPILVDYAAAVRKMGAQKKAKQLEARAKWISDRVAPQSSVVWHTLR